VARHLGERGSRIRRLVQDIGEIGYPGAGCAADLDVVQMSRPGHGPIITMSDQNILGQKLLN